MRPITLHNQREVYWAKQWLRGQVGQGRLINLSYEAIEHIDCQNDLQRILARQLDAHGRQRLQKALSARRAREKKSLESLKQSSSVRTVNTEITAAAREMLHVVAAVRGMTTSELLISLLEDEYYRVAR